MFLQLQVRMPLQLHIHNVPLSLHACIPPLYLRTFKSTQPQSPFQSLEAPYLNTSTSIHLQRASRAPFSTSLQFKLHLDLHTSIPSCRCSYCVRSELENPIPPNYYTYGMPTERQSWILFTSTSVRFQCVSIPS